MQSFAERFERLNYTMIFEFSIGGYFGDSYHLELIGSTLKCSKLDLDPDISREEILVVEGNAAWQQLLDFLSTRRWKKKYWNATLDGTQWELRVSGDNIKIDSYGSNVYPPGFKKFLRLLNDVVSEVGVVVY